MFHSKYTKTAEWLVRSLGSNVGYGHDGVETRPGNWLFVVPVHGDCEPGDALTTPEGFRLGHPCALARLERGLPIGIAVRPVEPTDVRITYLNRLRAFETAGAV